jgi:hypothetical protein
MNGACSYRENGKPRSTSWRRARAQRLDEAGAGGARGVPRELETRRRAPGDRVEIEDSDDVRHLRRLGGEVRCAEAAVGRAVAREERQGVRQRRGGRRGARRVGSCQLEERGGAGGVVVRAGAGAAVVAVRHDEDRLQRPSRPGGQEVDEPRPPVAGDRGREGVPPDPVAVRRHVLHEPPRRAERPGCARPPDRPLRGEIRCEQAGLDGIEGMRDRGRRQRRGPGHAEREDEQRQPDREPRAAVEAAVDRPSEGPRPRARGGRGVGGHVSQCRRLPRRRFHVKRASARPRRGRPTLVPYDTRTRPG